MTQGEGKVVLLVEDNPANMELAADLLEVAGYRVVRVTTAEAALDVAKKETFDVILMDVSLPGMDGLEAARRLKQDPRTAAMPVVAITSQAMYGDRDKAMAAGCAGYLTKPIDTRRFAQTVGAYVK
jgi:two-component system, cell cycle response regulator DivK